MRKSNRKIRRDKDAVSPVIATILMVAVTVVIAATVYSYTSGSGGSKRTTPAVSLSMKKTPNTNASRSDITLYHDGGEELQWADVKVLDNGVENTADPPSSGDFTVGESSVIVSGIVNGDGNHRVKVIWIPTNSILIDDAITI